jgi:hypothetical protein
MPLYLAAHAVVRTPGPTASVTGLPDCIVRFVLHRPVCGQAVPLFRMEPCRTGGGLVVVSGPPLHSCSSRAAKGLSQVSVVLLVLLVWWRIGPIQFGYRQGIRY